MGTTLTDKKQKQMGPLIYSCILLVSISGDFKDCHSTSPFTSLRPGLCQCTWISGNHCGNTIGHNWSIGLRSVWRVIQSAMKKGAAHMPSPASQRGSPTTCSILYKESSVPYASQTTRLT